MNCASLLDLDCPGSWPEEVLGYLAGHFDLFRSWATGHGGAGIDEAMRGLRDALAPYHLLGWHCTRLTDAECDDILQNGMRLPDAALLNCRIGALVKTGELTPYLGQRLTSKNDAAKTYRAGRIWFCFFPPGGAGQGGIERFFRHWGGEALYVRHESDLVTSPVLASTGEPRIVEARVPITLLRPHGYLEPAFYSRYLASRAIRLPPPGAYEDCIVRPLPAKNVGRVISMHDPDFELLTGHSEWDRPIPISQQGPKGG